MEPSDTEISKATYERLSEIRYWMRQFLSFSEMAAKEVGLTPQQHQLLLAIKGFPGRDYATPSELAERLQLRHNACVGLVTRCEQAGLVCRLPNESDHRSVYVALTDEGEAILEQLSRAHLEELKRSGVWVSRLFESVRD